jgi:hypothetical protein
MLEEIVNWCRHNPGLEATRREARSHFFGDEDERPVDYWPGTGELTSKERRFLGYFLFNWELPSGEHPGEAAVKRLYQGDVQAEALTAVRGARFVFAYATGIVGRSVYLELAKERFEVRSAQWAATLHRGLVVVAHLVPVRHGYWLPGPGWAELPFTLGEGMRTNLAEMQIDPITFERMLQHRSRPLDEQPRPEPPRDDDLDAAVARMTAWAEQRALSSLVMSAAEWEALVVKHMSNPTITAFLEDILVRIPEPPDDDEFDVNEMPGLLMNIWNNTPQPDRGGKTASQMARQVRES